MFCLLPLLGAGEWPLINLLRLALRKPKPVIEEVCILDALLLRLSFLVALRLNGFM